MPAQVKILESDAQIKSRFLFLLRKKADKALRKAAPIIENKCKLVLARTLNESPTIKSLLNGKLKVDFGLSDQMAQSSTNSIITYMSQNIVVELKSSKDPNLAASLIMTFPPVGASIYNIIPEGTYISNGIYGGGPVSWLEWLLTKGTQVVIEGLEVVQTIDYDSKSRSGGGFMIKTGQSFRVDPEFAGSENDNFLTKAIKNSVNEIQTIISNELIGAIR